MARSLIFIVEFYRAIFPFFRSLLSVQWHCRYTPTCSQYMIQQIESHGWRRGSWLGIKRLMSCHPFHQKNLESAD